VRHRNVAPHVAEGLKVLRARIAKANVAPSKLDESINLATWNVREFGRVRNGQRRSDAAIHYIAEILGQFDLVSLVELRDDLTDLRRVMDVLGPYWRVLHSDYDADHAGNRERLAFLYDKRAVVPTGLVAEAGEPRTKGAHGEYMPPLTWWRSPYMASFRAGSFDFVFLTAHVRWGDSEASRAKELRLLADWVDARVHDKGNDDRDYIVCGDFNIPDAKGPLFQAVTQKGLELPVPLRGPAMETNLARNKRYDQFLHYAAYTSTENAKGGVVDFYADDWRALFPASEYPKMTKAEFTYQLSDHLPLWMQLSTDVEGEQLDQVLTSRRAMVHAMRN